MIFVRLILLEQKTARVTNPDQDQVSSDKRQQEVGSDALLWTQGIILSSRFYCQEEDCGRGFSTQGFLDTHIKFFHPKKVNDFGGCGKLYVDRRASSRINRPWIHQ